MNNITKVLESIANRIMNFSNDPDLSNINISNVENAEKIGYFPRDFGMEQWDWPQGVAIFGLRKCNSKYDDYIVEWARNEIEKGLPTKNINTICPLLTLMDFEEFEHLSLEWMTWIENDFPKTKEGGLQHITSGKDKYSIKENDQQIWADTIFMSVLFIAKMGKKYHNDRWIELAKYQMFLHLKYLADSETGLFYHAWEFGENRNFGANFWCRGNCWLTLGIPLFIEIMGDDLNKSEETLLQNYYTNQVNSLINLKEEKSLWHTILNDPNSYVETSGSAGILAGILLGVNQNKLSIADSWIDNTMEALIKNVDEDGIVHGVSAGTAVSKNKNDYRNIIQIPMVYGQALTLVALAEFKNKK